MFKARPGQKEVVKFKNGKMGVSAVPGSGKTQTLSYLAARLIRKGYIADDQEILIVTLVNSAVNKLNGVANIGFSAGSTSDYAGSGSSTKDASFTTTVSARIVKVMANGNYFITGRREIMVDSEKQIMQLSGVIRPYDIDQNNQISSAKISDAKIMYVNQGDIDRSVNQGWGSKIIHAVWPF